MSASDNIGNLETPDPAGPPGGLAVNTTFAGLLVCPNVAQSGTGAAVNFSQLPANTTIKVYTLSGKLVRILADGNGVALVGPNKVGTWDGRNASGEKVASGVYIYVISVDGVTFSGAVVVIR